MPPFPSLWRFLAAFAVLAVTTFAAQPVLSDLSRLTWGHGRWYVALGTTLYSSATGKDWQEIAQLPDRAAALSAGPEGVAVAGRQYIHLHPYAQEIKPVTLEAKGEWIALCASGADWTGLDARGNVATVRAGRIISVGSLGERLRMSDVACNGSAQWWAVGARQGRGVIFQADAPEGPWTEAPMEAASPLLHVATANGIALVFGAGGAAYRQTPAEGWRPLNAFNAMGADTPVALAASARAGFAVLLKDGIVRSWDGLTWSRILYHEDEYAARTLVVTGGEPALVRLTPDDPAAGLYIRNLDTFPAPIQKSVAAGDAGTSHAFVDALVDWDTALSHGDTLADKAAATRAWLARSGSTLRLLSREELTAWINRLAPRLPVDAADPAGRRNWVRVLEETIAPGAGDLLMHSPPPAPLPEAADEENSIHPPIFDVDAMRHRAASGQPGARLDLAIAYLHGVGLRADRAAADFWLSWAHAVDPAMPTLAQLEENALSLERIRQRAEGGSSWAQVLLADHYREGSIVEIDFGIAADWYRKAAELGNYDAATALGELYFLGWGVDRDPVTAVALFSEPARAHHPLGLYNFGRCFELGAGVPRDLDRARYYYQQASEMGEPRSLRKLADLALAAKDTAAARAFLTQGAEAGDRESERRLELLGQDKYHPLPVEAYARYPLRAASFNLPARLAVARSGDAGACYDLSWAARNGQGMYPNTRYALWWLERAKKLGAVPPPSDEDMGAMEKLAAQGSLVAATQLAENLLEGLHIAQDTVRARRLFSQAAEKGHFGAQGRLGMLLREGVGGPANPIEGTLWLERAAGSGDPLAHYELAKAYAAGAGVKLDPPKAVQHYRDAATGGVRRAQVDLAFLIASGQISGASPNEASAWYLALAGLEAVTCPPDTAARRIEEEAARGSGSAQAVWAVLLRLGFGTAVNSAEATAWSLVAEDQQANLYALNWYSEKGDAPAAALRAAEIREKIKGP